MSELDIEALKQIADRINEAEHEDPDVWLALLEDFAEYVPAIIAALEDRDRLRAAGVNLITSRDRTVSTNWATVRRSDYDALIAALEGRDG